MGRQKDRRFLVVRSGALKCALPASDVVRIVRGLTCFPIPGSEVRLLGLAQYAGEPLPVLDLHAVVEGTTSGSRHRSTVILGRSRRRDRTILGLAVDEVLQVVELPIENMGAADAGVTANSTIEGAEVKVVNTARLLTDTMDDTGAMHG